MRSETLIQHHPPTPPNANAELHSGLHQLAQYNADRSYSFEDSQHHDLSYSSPMLQDGTAHASHIEDHSSVGFGLGIPYENYGQGSEYYQDGRYNGMTNNAAMFSGSPPTPRSVDDNDDFSRRTRSGRTIAPSSSPQEQEKPKPKATPKAKKGKTGKNDKPKTPKLTAPLSVLTKDFTSVPVRNMEEWVNRSPEQRRKEVEKRNGYITRPMNSFMLYRSAYAERTKQWCLQNNHQVVSSVSGESWPLEPPEIRELYNEYAKIERINHQNAHPTYKFSPSKTSVPARKRKGEYSDDDEPSDLDDAEWAPAHARPRARHTRRPERSLDYSANSIHTGFFDRSFGSHGTGMNKSSWELTNEGRPMPMPMMQGDLYSQYYQPSVHPSMGMGHGMIEDLRIRRVDTPGLSMQFPSGHVLLGLPGGNATDMMQQLHSNSGTPLGDEHQVDPMLLAYDGGHHHDASPAVIQHNEFRNGHMGMMEREFDQESVNSILGTTTAHDEFQADSWHPDPNMGPMEPESEFEKWMGEH